jgi:hypothetical protein
MPSISQKIPNLLGGISQQPDPVKLDGQVNDARNITLDPTFGCKKRPPLKFVGELDNGTAIPSSSHWFPIFRDETERYVAVAYQSGGNGVLRVWNADTGAEQTVNSFGDSLDYIKANDPLNIHELTINDYTMIANSEKVVTMSTNSGAIGNPEALLVVNEVGYDTTYSVDFIKSANNQKVKIYKATKLSISPSSFEVNDNTCSLGGQSDYVENGTGTQQALGFSILANCTPTLVTTTVPGIPYPTAVQLNASASSATSFAQTQFGDPDSYGAGSYLYHTATGSTATGTISVKIEFRVNGDNRGNNSYAYSNVAVTGYSDNSATDNNVWAVGNTFSVNTSNSARSLGFKVTNIQKGPDGQAYSYKSVYATEVKLNSGGTNWRIGDSVSVSLQGKQYTITVEEESFSYGFVAEATASFTTVSSGVLDINDIVSGLKTDIDSIGTYDTETVGNVIRVKRNDSGDFNLQASGGTTNRALYAIKSEVSDISQLPAQCINNVVLKIRNTAAATADDYFVKFEATSGEIPGTGTWVETVKPGIPTDLNISSMPHVLIREANGEFSFRGLSKSAQKEAATFYGETVDDDDFLFWSGRAVGDESTNPSPTFVDKTVVDMFFYQNRLGFLAGENVILSQAGDYYNFFGGSAIALSDADPIDLTATSTKPSRLKRALGTSKGLLMFAENSQFLLATTDTAFGPSTVKLTEISNYSYTSKIKPLESGVSVIFSTEADTFSKVFEMALESIDNRPLVADNTRIIPELIPPDLTIAATSPNNSFLAFGNGNNELFTFSFFNEGNNRTIAGWAIWEFPSDIKLFDFTHDTSFTVMFNPTSDSHVLSRMEFLDDPETAPISVYGSKFVPRLDNYIYDTDTTIVTTGDVKKVTFPNGFFVENTDVYVMDSTQGVSIRFFKFTPVLDSNGTYYIEIPSDLTDDGFIVGLAYNMLVKLPSFFVKEEKKSDRRNIPVCENVFLDMHLSGSVDVLLERVGYDNRSLTIAQPVADVYISDSPAITDVLTDAIPVFCLGSLASLTISADGPLPVALSSYSWEGHYNNRGILLID